MNKVIFFSALVMVLGIYEGVDGYKIAEPDYSAYREPEGESNNINNEHDVSESVSAEDVGDDYYNEDVVAEDYEDYIYKEPEITVTEMMADEELNCMMQYPSDSTDEINRCCKVMDHNNATTYTAEEIERCMLLYVKVVFDYDADIDVIEMAETSRSSPRCEFLDNKAYLANLCCLKNPCERYERNVLRSMCFNCVEMCPSCNGWLIH